MGNPDLGSFSMTGKVALITGGMGLIGGEICRTLSKAEAVILVADQNPAVSHANLATNLGLSPTAVCDGYRVDISDAAQVDEMVHSFLSRHDRIDVLINCAAIDSKFDSSANSDHNAALHDMPIETWEQSLRVNVTGTFLATRRVLQQMLKQSSGNIINVASVYALVSPDQSLYGDRESPSFRPKPVDYVATKSFMPNFTRYIATTYGRNNIRANTIVPHGIETDHDKAFKRRFAQRSPVGRMCRLEEIGPPVLFLASEASSYMTGSTLVVDGGWTAW